MFPKCRGGKGVYDVLTLQKSRGAKCSPELKFIYKLFMEVQRMYRD